MAAAGPTERDEDRAEGEDRSAEERKRIEREMREQAREAQDEPVEGYERQVADRPDPHEPTGKTNLHARAMQLPVWIFAVLVAVVIAFILALVF